MESTVTSPMEGKLTSIAEISDANDVPAIPYLSDDMFKIEKHYGIVFQTLDRVD